MYFQFSASLISKMTKTRRGNKHNVDDLTYPTVVMVTKAHQNPSKAP